MPKTTNLKTAVIDGKKWTLSELRAMTGKSYQVIKNRIRLYEEGEITAQDIFSSGHLDSSTGGGGTDEWKALSDKPRTGKLNHRTGSWESENIPQPTGYKIRSYRRHTLERPETSYHDSTYRIADYRIARSAYASHFGGR